MSRVDRSPEQLNAEAAAPYAPLAPRLVLHRLLAHDEATILKLHVRDGDDSGVGVPFNETFARFLEEKYGTQYPWSAGLKSVRVECRRSHPEHWRDPFRGSLCATLVSMVCRFDWDYGKACLELGLYPSKTEATMQRALRRIEERLDELQARATSTVESDKGRHDWLAPVHEHRSVPGLHMQECRQCLRREGEAA